MTDPSDYLHRAKNWLAAKCTAGCIACEVEVFHSFLHGFDAPFPKVIDQCKAFGWIKGPMLCGSPPRSKKLYDISKAVLDPIPPEHDNARRNDDTRPCYERDHLWLKWYESAEEPTCGSPAKVRDKWNAMSEPERKQEAPICHNKVMSTAAVKTAIYAARKARDQNEA